MVTPAQRHYTFEDYLSVEEMSDVRHEFFNGQIFAMAGGTPEHAALSAAIVVVIGTKLQGSQCRTYSSDLRIRVLATGLATYPDAAVICGPAQRDPASPSHVTNPTVVIEVLSPKTEDYDRGEKREHYQQIETLREYVLIAQDRQCVEVFVRRASGGWEQTTSDDADIVTLPSLGVTFSMNELYSTAGLNR